MTGPRITRAALHELIFCPGIHLERRRSHAMAWLFVGWSHAPGFGQEEERSPVTTGGTSNGSAGRKSRGHPTQTSARPADSSPLNVMKTPPAFVILSAILVYALFILWVTWQGLSGQQDDGSITPWVLQADASESHQPPLQGRITQVTSMTFTSR